MHSTDTDHFMASASLPKQRTSSGGSSKKSLSLTVDGLWQWRRGMWWRAIEVTSWSCEEGLEGRVSFEYKSLIAWVVATFRVARLIVQTPKLQNFGWSVSRPTVTLVALACVSFHFFCFFCLRFFSLYFCFFCLRFFLFFCFLLAFLSFFFCFFCSRFFSLYFCFFCLRFFSLYFCFFCLRFFSLYFCFFCLRFFSLYFCFFFACVSFHYISVFFACVSFHFFRFFCLRFFSFFPVFFFLLAQKTSNKIKKCCNVWMTIAFLTHHEKAAHTGCHKVSRTLPKIDR